MPRILIFSPSFSPTQGENPEGIVGRKLALAMLDAGWDVDIITRNYLNGGNIPQKAVWKEPWLKLEKHTFGIPYDLKTMKSFSGIVKTILNIFKFGHVVGGIAVCDEELKLGLDMHKKKPYDLIISRSNPDCAHLTAMNMAGQTGLPWIANWDDPSEAILPKPFNFRKYNNIILKLLTIRFIKEVARRATVCSFPSERLMSYINSYIGASAGKKSRVMPHIAMDFHIEKKQEKNNKFIIAYAGGIDNKTRNLKGFISALKRFVQLKRAQDILEIRFYGDTDDKIIDTEDFNSLKNNIKFMGHFDYLDCMKELAKADILLILEAPFKEGIFMPTKTPDYVQTGKPILAVSPKIGTLNDIIGRSGGGVSADCTSPEAIADAIGLLYEHWQKGDINDLYGSWKLKDIFSSESVISKYREIFSNLAIQ